VFTALQTQMDALLQDVTVFYLELLHCNKRSPQTRHVTSPHQKTQEAKQLSVYYRQSIFVFFSRDSLLSLSAPTLLGEKCLTINFPMMQTHV